MLDIRNLPLNQVHNTVACSSRIISTRVLLEHVVQGCSRRGWRYRDVRSTTRKGQYFVIGQELKLEQAAVLKGIITYVLHAVASLSLPIPGGRCSRLPRWTSWEGLEQGYYIVMGLGRYRPPPKPVCLHAAHRRCSELRMSVEGTGLGESRGRELRVLSI